MTLAEFIAAFRARAAETRMACFYCGVHTERDVKESHGNFSTRDHVVPRSAMKGYRGALQPKNNRVTCCRKCNSVKEDLTLAEFKRRRELTEFYAETFLGTRVENLDDYMVVTEHILLHRRVEGRSIKFQGKRVVRTSHVTMVTEAISADAPGAEVLASNNT